jgi:hypothetical protein
MPFSMSPDEIAEAIARAPERVDDPDSPYDPNDPAAVGEFWKDASLSRNQTSHPGGETSAPSALPRKRTGRDRRR